MPMDVILLERVDKLGSMGEKVRVKPGFARNFLLPQGKALRATPENVAYFEAQRSALEKVNAEKRAAAQTLAKKLESLKVALIRNASEGGQLYGSVTSRDIADAVKAASKIDITRGMVVMNDSLKTIGLFPVTIALHPEVRVDVTINVARSEDEARAQAKTGKALIAEDSRAAAAETAVAKESFLEEGVLEAEEAEAEEETRDAAKKAEKTARRTARKAAKADKSAPEGVEEEAAAEE